MDNEQKSKYVLAGKITAEALELGKKKIKAGAKILDIITELENFILEHEDAKLAFPINFSLNECAAHDTADINDERILTSNDVVKLDVGVQVDGYIADAAITVDLTGKYTDLLKAAKQALDKAVKLARPGTKIGEIGMVIQDTIESYGFKPIVNLSGHKIERYALHTGISIPNIKTANTQELKKGDVIAIEPFSTTGNGRVYESANPKIFMLGGKVPMRLPLAKELLKKIETEFEGLPFSYRQLFDLGIDRTKIQFAFSQIRKSNCLQEFPPLIEEAKGIVAQFEHTVIVDDAPVVITKG